ncbi:sodium/calcium transporter [Grosmannia clavigera kw1407]|uniref:Sodium/calcium transporter n=1 Tax=Grosmannia clavigera (strain kw1407 / UAMH 11150) TaxID=655863 RepID=F0XAC2_GROCL|nr:sodium/calcium transporter [Grosmannia clavigera kw1407]EFX05918.1 sodium/calcium transporter [Grosmannia clavigera kw1407]
MPFAVNNFRIKREAHSLGRQTSNAPFNPFSRRAWSSAQARRNTFPATGPSDDPEACIGSDDGIVTDRAFGNPIGHVHTAPATSQSEATAFDSGPYTGQYGEDATAFLGPQNVNAPGPDGNGLKKRKTNGLSPTNEDAEEVQVKDKTHRMYKDVQPKEPFTVANQLQRVFLGSFINILLLAAPVGIALHFTSVDPIAIFVVNFIAIIPLAAMLSFATEEIALRTGETLGGLLNATFGNAVELIVAVMALIKKEVVIVQTSLIGSILSNLLLVMGMCFFFGGLRRQEQYFNTTVAQTAASLLALAVSGVIVPTVFDAASITSQSDVAMLSRGTAIILLVVYAAYLFFQLKTHHAVFSEESKKVPAKPFKHHVQPGAVRSALVNPAGLAMGNMEEERLRVSEKIANGPDDDEPEDPQLHMIVAMAVLAGSTVIIALCAEFLVDSIDYVTSTGGMSKEFLGLILLPIVGNAAEHATAVTVAIKDKMDLAIGVAVGSSMQVALFLIPLLVVIGWGMGMDDMSLSFDIFQVAVMFVAVLLVNYLIADGKSHWLEGMLLMCLYCIIATCSWWYPA